MKAAVLEQFDAPLAIRDVDVAQPGANEVLVRTAAVGLCHSDLHMMQGLRDVPLPMVLGHEVAGVVEAVGSQVTGLKPGDRWCLCALRWKEAYEAGVAPPVILESTHARALDFVTLAQLQSAALSAG